MIKFDDTDIKIIKLYYNLGKSEKPDLWGLMLQENPELRENGSARIREIRTKKYNSLKARVSRLQRELVDVQTIRFTKRNFEGKKLHCIEIKICGFWHVYAIEK